MNITLTLFSCIEHRPSEISYFLFSQGRVERRVSKKFQIPPRPPLHYIEASTIFVNHYTRIYKISLIQAKAEQTYYIPFIDR